MGPSDLYKVVKEIGKFVRNLQTFSAEATSQFETNMESNLQLEEIRKAQAELNDAFSFRRSINVDADTEAFEVNAQSPRGPTPQDVASTTGAMAAVANEDAPASAAAAAPPAKKKIRRRRVKKKKAIVDPGATTMVASDPTTSLANDVPDLSVDDSLSESEKRMMASIEQAQEELRAEEEEEQAQVDEAEHLTKSDEAEGLLENAKRREAYLERLQSKEEEFTEDKLEASEQEANAARFQAQMSGNWNDQILAKEADLTPVAEIMERLAILEEEKMAADQRLQEEFRLREENEEKFYREKRKLLEEAAAKIQAKAYDIEESTTST